MIEKINQGRYTLTNIRFFHDETSINLGSSPSSCVDGFYLPETTSILGESPVPDFRQTMIWHGLVHPNSLGYCKVKLTHRYTFNSVCLDTQSQVTIVFPIGKWSTFMLDFLNLCLKKYHIPKFDVSSSFSPVEWLFDGGIYPIFIHFHAGFSCIV